MAMEKLRLISPALHFNILRNMDFFTVDRLGVCVNFYEIPVQQARGDSPTDIVARAREAYQGYSFHQGDLREKIRNRGTRNFADQRLTKRPTLLPKIITQGRLTKSVKLEI